jgi:hypothetical protein
MIGKGETNHTVHGPFKSREEAEKYANKRSEEFTVEEGWECIVENVFYP